MGRPKGGKNREWSKEEKFKYVNMVISGEKSGTGFQRVNELCLKQNVSWTFRKEAYGFFFEFIRTNVHLNVQINVHLTEQEQRIFNLIDSNDRITKEELAVRINKSEKTVQRIISKLISYNFIERVGSNKDGYWKVIK